MLGYVFASIIKAIALMPDSEGFRFRPVLGMKEDGYKGMGATRLLLNDRFAVVLDRNGCSIHMVSFESAR
jgi:hypothetical protein